MFSYFDDQENKWNRTGGELIHLLWPFLLYNMLRAIAVTDHPIFALKLVPSSIEAIAAALIAGVDCSEARLNQGKQIMFS